MLSLGKSAPTRAEIIVRQNEIHIEDVEALRSACRAMVRKRAVLAAATSLIPIPGVDVLTDVALMVGLVQDINQRFGLSEAQLSRGSQSRKALTYKLMVSAGGMLASRLGLASLLVAVLKRVGGRLVALEVTRLIPIAGQIVAAGIAYWAMTSLLFRHIDDCARVHQQMKSETIVSLN